MTTAITELSGRALRDVDTIAARAAREVVDAEGDLADSTRIPAQDVADTVAHLIRDFFRHLALGTDLDIPTVREVGRRRAGQGVPLAAVLHGFRIGFRHTWGALAALTTPDDTRTLRALLDQSDTMWHLLDTYSDELRAAYRDHSAELLRYAEAERHRHLSTLFSAETDAGARLHSAEALGLPRHGAHLVLAVRGDTPRHRSAWEAALSPRAGVLWHITPGGTAGLLSAPAAEDLTGAVLRVRITEDATRAGSSRTFARLEDAPEALRQARIALRAHPVASSRAHSYDEDPVASLVAAGGQDARALTDVILGPLDALPAQERGLLLETAAAWLDAAGSTEDAARSLYCHRNTVRYRLRRIEDLTGLPLKDPRNAARLHLALHTVRQHR
ncbi:PucR family transcriptional regulator [Streptomyces sp. NBC_01089]|uniref:PucR family transcriptional regulator n=1 Tax=Streptomyces sp. NBC_01089 TaxID=2903747 RepID=UPI0038696904|nr:helix-turn-helix domain-containing protein [Streptomyces sp. NBC_01089]